MLFRSVTQQCQMIDPILSSLICKLSVRAYIACETVTFLQGKLRKRIALMADGFDVEAEAKIVDGLARKACSDWQDSPASYEADAARLSQEVSKLAQQGVLEYTLEHVPANNSWNPFGEKLAIKGLFRGADGKISGIEFDLYEPGVRGSHYYKGYSYARVDKPGK